jgi:hypothetical protein
MKEHYISPFDSDDEAQEVIDTSRQLQSGHWINWQQFGSDGKQYLTLDGNYTFAELTALIHFHPELAKRRAEEQPEAKSDEVRLLELAVQKLSETLNEVLEVCDPTKTDAGSVERQYVQLKRIFMRARASLPAGYSMSLTKKET